MLALKLRALSFWKRELIACINFQVLPTPWRLCFIMFVKKSVNAMLLCNEQNIRTLEHY